MKAALEADKVVTLASADTVADGCAVKTAGTLTFEFCKKYLDDIITVSEIDIMNALLSLIEKHKLVAEGAGVLSLAALAKLPFQGKKVVSIISGGNIDISTISALIDKALIARGEVEEAAAALEALARLIDGPGNRWQDILDGGGNLAVLLLHDRDHLECRTAVDMSGGRIAALRREFC